MTRKQIIAIHILAWAVYTAYEAIGYFIRLDAKPLHLYLGLSFTFVRLVQFYFCYLLIFPLYGRRDKMLKLILGIVSGLALFIVLRYVIEEMLFPYYFGFDNYNDGTTLKMYVGDNVYWGTPVIMVAAILWSIQNAFNREQENKLLRQEATRAELAFLRSQINPHFLYNTLNYIYSLAMPVSEKLANAVMHLSDLMRYTLKESGDGKVKLVQEVSYIENYIELFRMRFAPGFFVDVKTEGVEEQHTVASLILIPFVENALKHGVINEPGRPIRIKLVVVGNRLMFTVSNKISRALKDHSSGVGLVNLKRRLELLYPGRHQLLISENGQTYKTTLNLTLD
jgi:two-component system, LytTR family, sensor kinase